jgi:hypothetical protein
LGDRREFLQQFCIERCEPQISLSRELDSRDADHFGVQSFERFFVDGGSVAGARPTQTAVEMAESKRCVRMA